MSAIVEASELVKRYGGMTAVKGVSFSVAEGLFYGLLGANGAGKTTTMRMIYQVTPPTSGRLTVFGLPTGREARRIKQKMGVVPQMDNLDEELSVEDNLRIYARFNGAGRQEADLRARQMLDFVELTGRRGANVRQLSGGMKRRLTLARGLMNSPRLLILDEPTTGLDPQVRQSIWEKLDALRSEGLTLIMSTHYMDEAERLCDYLFIMDAGRIVDEGAPRELIARYLPPSAIEVRVTAARAPRLQLLTARFGDRVVHGTGRATVFTDDVASVAHDLQGEGFGLEETFVRPSNLEDVFLKLTGRRLRE